MVKTKDDCNSCGHPKRFHATALEHDNGTSHCTYCSKELIYCHCPEYKGD